ncbi:sensor histidine kinase [Larkinella terrae]|uniref:histidine kinase n=1 Tax=Larkinella terrae TaxID=2025311 RepID=A0A7K0EDT9_9BACT|nr:ATP-binding protein [Larkinella terrae]MRS60020.1 PAS domain S-box protein [Larkinella terrae]
MEDLAKVSLDNEMDLILAHKRTMKLAELAGLSLAAQTTFATAVSEVARYAIELGTRPQLTLSALISPKKQYLVVTVEDEHLPVANPLNQGLLYAQRLVEKLEIATTDVGSRITLYCGLPSSRKISTDRFANWRSQFVVDQPLSTYDEIKRKNDQLQELAGRLHDSEQHYKRVTDSLPLMIFTANQAGQLLYANAWVTDFTGFSIQSLNQTRWAKVMHPDDFTDFWKEWVRKADNSLPFLYECRLKEQTKQAYEWHLFSAVPVKNEPVKVTAWSGFVVNIHAQKIVGQTIQEKEELAQAKTKLEQSERDLQATVSELNRSNAELSQFAYVASHDLQEPLRKIQAFGEILVNQYAPQLDHTGTDLINRMQTAANRMKVLVKDLLSYSRLTTKQQPFELLNLNQLLSEILIDLETSIQEKKATIVAAELPAIQGDPLQLRQLFQNLLSNALKFSKSGQQPVIQVAGSVLTAGELPAFVPRTGSSSYVSISVADNGIGFEQKFEDRIFRLFQRLHGHSQYEGTGMGLAICKKVADNHQGYLTVRSEPNQGSTFVIYLPVER